MGQVQTCVIMGSYQGCVVFSAAVCLWLLYFPICEMKVVLAQLLMYLMLCR